MFMARNIQDLETICEVCDLSFMLDDHCDVLMTSKTCQAFTTFIRSWFQCFECSKVDQVVATVEKFI